LQLLIADARLAYGVYDLLGKILIGVAADGVELLLRVVGERAAQIIHYHSAAIAQNVA
jgi:hypothetical protein